MIGEPRIQSTRDMCHALKEHVGRVEEGLALGESDRNSLRGLNQHRITDYQVNDVSQMQ